MRFLIMTALLCVITAAVHGQEDLKTKMKETIEDGLKFWLDEFRPVNPSILHLPCDCAGVKEDHCRFTKIELLIKDNAQIQSIKFLPDKSDISSGSYVFGIYNFTGTKHAELEGPDNQDCEHLSLNYTDVDIAVEFKMDGGKVSSVKTSLLKQADFTPPHLSEYEKEDMLEITEHYFSGFFSGFLLARMENLLQ